MLHFFPLIFPRQTRSLAALGLLLAATETAQAQIPASFSPVSTYPTGFQTFPYSVAVADVNGDGRPDLVTANYGHGTVGVLLGQNNGNFAAIHSYLTGGTFPCCLAVADVNSDGQPDIVTANNLESTVGVLLGQPSGDFAGVNTYSAGAIRRPQGVAVADVNGDGRLDIVTANTGSGTVGILLGQVGGGFATASTYSTGGTLPTAVAVADMDSDGRLDIVTANSTTAGVLLGQVGGGFAPVSTYPTGGGTSATSLAVADMNNDGRPDIVTTNSLSNTAGVLLGQATGGFALISTYSTGAGSNPHGVAVTDVNGDGRPDIVTANTDSGTAGVLLGQAGGGFTAVNTYSAGAGGLTLYSVAVADVNGDGRVDILTANYGSSTVGVLLNTGTFTPLASTPNAVTADVALFPNPAHGSFTVQLSAAWSVAPVRAELLNALGQIVSTRTEALPTSGTAFTMETVGLSAGIYALRLQAGSHALTKRVVLN